MEDLRYDYAKEIYKVESDRENNLNNKSQIYLSLLTIILSSLIFNIKDIFDLLNLKELSCIKSQSIFILVCVLISSSVAIGMIFLSMKLFNYKNPYKLDSLKVHFESKDYNKQELEQNVCTSYLVATKINKEVNDDKAKFLHFSYIFIIISFILSVIFLTLVLTFK